MVGFVTSETYQNEQSIWCRNIQLGLRLTFSFRMELQLQLQLVMPICCLFIHFNQLSYLDFLTRRLHKPLAKTSQRILRIRTSSRGNLSFVDIVMGHPINEKYIPKQHLNVRRCCHWHGYLWSTGDCIIWTHTPNHQKNTSATRALTSLIHRQVQ